MRVVEIFRSIQGEGRSQGCPSVFLRLSGCNINCAWCDTGYAREGGTELSGDEVMQAIQAFPGRLLCITGGEPLLQADLLLPLVRRLHAAGYRIEIETNGTLGFGAFQPYASLCMDVKCPSSGERSDLSLLPLLSERDSVKFVVQGIGDCLYAEEVLAGHPVRGRIFFSPVYGSDYGAVADFLIGRDLPARFQLQLHRRIGVR